MQKIPSTLRIRRVVEADREAITALAQADHGASAFGKVSFGEKKFNSHFDKVIRKPQQNMALLLVLVIALWVSILWERAVLFQAYMCYLLNIPCSNLFWAGASL